MIIHTLNNQKAALTKLADLVAEEVIEQLTNGKKVCLFLGGGSLVNSYDFLAEKLFLARSPEIELDFDLLTITLTDERLHTDQSNAMTLYTKSKILVEAMKSGANILLPNFSQNPKASVAVFDKFLTTIFNETNQYYPIGVVGVGVDGHIAGIKPNPSAERFSKTFVTPKATQRFVANYDWADDFPWRITLNPKALELLNSIYVGAFGELKLGVLDQLAQLSAEAEESGQSEQTKQPKQPKRIQQSTPAQLSDLHTFPARLLLDCPQVQLITDQVV